MGLERRQPRGKLKRVAAIAQALILEILTKSIRDDVTKYFVVVSDYQLYSRNSSRAQPAIFSALTVSMDPASASTTRSKNFEALRTTGDPGSSVPSEPWVMRIMCGL